MTADRLHQVPAPDSPWGSLGMVTESLKSGTPPLRGSRPTGRHEAMPRYRSTVFVSQSCPRLALFAPLRLGEPFGKARDTAARRFEVGDRARPRVQILHHPTSRRSVGADQGVRPTQHNLPRTSATFSRKPAALHDPLTVKVVTGDTACLFRGASCYVNAGLVPNDYRLEPVRWLHERWSADERRVMLHVFR